MARRARTAPSRNSASRRAAAARVFAALTVEGALIAPAQVALIADAKAEGQAEEDYRVPRGLTLRDEIPRFFRIAQALWNDLGPGESTSRAATIGFVEKLMRDVLAFADVAPAPAREREGRVHPVTLEALGGRVPVVVVPPTDALDRPSAALSASGRRTSTALVLQDWLNASDEALWGLACNGEKLRLVRDNPSLTRPAYIEADLRQMFEGEDLADFTAFWLLLHASRFGRPDTPPTDCTLERWRDAGQKAGVVARDRLRDGVEEALKALGTGFVAHPANTELRRKLEDKSLDLLDFHSLLLRLVYRLIFLLAAEDRNLLHTPSAPAAARQVYGEGYSLSRLRTRAAKRTSWDAHDDLWDGLQVTFAALARGESALGLPALGGLFGHGALGALEGCALPNRGLMAAVYRLAWLKDEAGVQQVNWRDMETEELGSVYEALLELTPRLSADGRAYGFAEGAETRGNQRKTTGSYYTPDSLVQLLLDSALDPVLDRAEREDEDPAKALLEIKVIDPACGSGHFLLAAARRIAARVARHRAGGAASAEDYRHALRDVARSCIHGVDRNPMAVELAKVALWIETVDPGKPLGFLDAAIRCGDSLFGVFDLATLEKGVPDAAYRPLAGDDPAATRLAGKANRDQKTKVQGDLFGRKPGDDLARRAQAVLALSEDDAFAVERKAAAWKKLHAEGGWGPLKLACDLYVAAFLREKQMREDGRGPDRVPTTVDVWTALSGGQPDAHLAALAVDLAGRARAFHWPLEFPAVMARGGFDVVLGNPPWERIKLQEQEFFASRSPEIAAATNKAIRERLIEALAQAPAGSFERSLSNSFVTAKREAEATSEFVRVDGDEGGRFALTGCGDVNTYALFAELFANLARDHAGVIVPTGIATDATTAPFFAALIENHRLARLVDFENRAGLFPAVDSRLKFSLLTLGRNEQIARFSFFLTDPAQLADAERNFSLTPTQIAAINPNTRNAPVFRASADAALASKVYVENPTFGLPRDRGGWQPRFLKKMFDFGIHQELLEFSCEPPTIDHLPIYEAKMIWHFDHRFATYAGVDADAASKGNARELKLGELCNPAFEISPRCWTHKDNFKNRMANREWDRHWLLSMRDKSQATNERTAIFAIRPYLPSNDTIPCIFIDDDPKKIAALVGNLSSLTFDYFARQKVGGLNVAAFVLEQLPVLPPGFYTSDHLAFIIPRVLELVYTSHSLASFAHDLGHDGPPFQFDGSRRSRLRAELDAWYARAYGLTRDELRYVLDPADVMGSDYPSETFRVLKEKEIRRFGEYRTQRLVLEAWDALVAGELGIADRQAILAPASVELPPLDALPDGAWAWQATIQPQDRLRYAAQHVLGLMNLATDGTHARLVVAGLAEPALLTSWLSGNERSQWIRLVGGEARPAQGVVRLRPAVNAAWRSMFETLIASGQLEEKSDGSWARGPDFSPAGLQSDSADARRAAFAIQVIRRVDLSNLRATVAAEDGVIWARFGGG